MKQRKTMVIEPAFGTFSTVGRWQVLPGNENQHAHTACHQSEAWDALEFSGSCVDCGVQKTRWTNTNMAPQTQTITYCEKKQTLGLKQESPLFSRPWDLASKWNANLTSIWKWRAFGSSQGCSYPCWKYTLPPFIFYENVIAFIIFHRLWGFHDL